jgi:hypothetical protein
VGFKRGHGGFGLVDNFLPKKSRYLRKFTLNNPIFLFLPANPIMPFFRFGFPVIPLGSAANPIVVDYSPQELYYGGCC